MITVFFSDNDTSTSIFLLLIGQFFGLCIGSMIRAFSYELQTVCDLKTIMVKTASLKRCRK